MTSGLQITEIAIRRDGFRSKQAALYVVLQGEWSFTANGLSEPKLLRPGHLVLHWRPARHAFVVDAARRESNAAGQSPELIAVELEGGTLPGLPRESDCLIHEVPLDLFKRVAFGLTPTAPADSMSAVREHRLAAVIIALLLSCEADTETVPTTLPIDEELTQVMLAMERDPAHPWTVERLADLAGISRSAFAAKFKEQTGQTPADYLLETRMTLADRLLRGGRHQLKEIARLAGYQTPAAFSTAFKRWSGQSPGAFRKSLRAEN